ncbi:Uncharacterised protein [uncultured archaeon]|nr:Uncharacterised protein [uncultured archaeon]
MKRNYEFHLLNPFTEDNLDFYEMQAGWKNWDVLEKRWTLLFQSGREKEVIAELSNSTLRLPLKKRHTPLVKIDEDYYAHQGDISCLNQNETTKMTIARYLKIDLNSYKEEAVKVATKMIREHDLSLGDRAIVRNVALLSLEKIIELLSSESRFDFPIDLVLELDKNEGTIEELERYGFEVDSTKVRTYR